MGLKEMFLYGDYRATKPLENEIQFGVPAVIGPGIANAWGALSTTGKVLVGAGAGAGVYAAYDWLFGGSTKKEQAVNQQAAPQDQKQSQPTITTTDARVYHAPYETYQPKTDIRNIISYDYSTNLIENSPYATISKKQPQDASGNTPGSWNTPQITNLPVSVSPAQSATQQQEQATTQQQGIDWATIAAIAGVALVAYGYTSRKDSK